MTGKEKARSRLRSAGPSKAYLHHPPRWQVTSGVHSVLEPLDLSVGQSQFHSVMLAISLTDRSG